MPPRRTLWRSLQRSFLQCDRIIWRGEPCANTHLDVRIRAHRESLTDSENTGHSDVPIGVFVRRNACLVRHEGLIAGPPHGARQ